MSDGMTDAYRMQRDAEEFEEYLKAVERYLAEQTEPHFTAAMRQVKKTLRKYVRSTTDSKLWELGLHWLAELKTGNRKAWASLLADAWQTREFAPLKALSPFKDKLFLIVKDDFGSIEVGGELDRLVPSQVHVSAKRFAPRQYVVVLDPPDANEAETILIKSRELP